MLLTSHVPFSLLLLIDITVLSLCNALHVPTQQTRLDINDHTPWYHQNTPPHTRPLHGRFLHITDLHPDPYYKFNTTIVSACHSLPVETGVNAKTSRDKDKVERRAGYWGTPQSSCDNSIAFVNFTLDWIENEWADNVDFVVWTGDNARHDEDPSQPRTLQEIFDTNQYVAERMHSIFTVRGIPVVTSLGNNDIWREFISIIKRPGKLYANGKTSTPGRHAAHNILESGPNVFQRGGYYSTELIGNQLAALSLNTLYFYEKNKAIEGCTYRDETNPGNLQLAWMDVQLEQFRSRGMKVWLTGHVPPTPHNYYNECYRRYVELSMRYRDTIVGHLYGHMNIDFFFFLDPEHLKKEPKKDELFSKKDQIHKSLKKHIKKIIKKKDKIDGLAVVNVAPAVVGNPYQPGLRVFAYNHTGGSGVGDEDWIESEREMGTKMQTKTSRKPWKKPKKCKKKKNRDDWECREPEREWYEEKGPAGRNTLWTALGYSQFWAPDLETKNGTNPPTWELEYVTYSREAFEGKLPARIADIVRPTLTDEQIPYKMNDLTLDSWLELAEEVSDKKKQWNKFKERMYMSVG